MTKCSSSGFDLVLETDEFLLLDKKAGITFQGQQEGQGLLAEIREYFDTRSIYPTHRLDKMTSGLLLLAKTREANRALSLAFQERRIEKYYLAISELKPKRKQGLICGDMLRSRRGSWQLSREMTRPALTQFFSYSISPGRRLFLLKPHTGKTHQLRVALKSIGAPIMGDSRYCPVNKSLVKNSASAQADRGYLHSYALRFELWGKPYSQVLLPSSGECFNESRCQALLSDLETPWDLSWPTLSANLLAKKPQ